VFSLAVELKQLQQFIHVLALFVLWHSAAQTSEEEQVFFGG
jgi:hypothetical protein